MKKIVLFCTLLAVINSCKTIEDNINARKNLSKWTKMPKRVALDLAELKTFNIILSKSEKKDIKNQKFILDEKKSKWLKIKFANNRTGWIKGSYAKIINK